MQNLMAKEGLATQRSTKLNDMIQNIVLSYEMDIFKVTYFGVCPSSEEWYRKISEYLTGLLINFSREYELCVITQTFSDEHQRYLKKEYHFQKILGTSIVDHCFNTIPEISICDMLCIMMKFSDEMDYSFCTRRRNNACYLFARDKILKLESVNLLTILRGKKERKNVQRMEKQKEITKIQSNTTLRLKEMSINLCKLQTEIIDLANIIFFRKNELKDPDDWGMFINQEIFHGEDRERLFNFEITVLHCSEGTQMYETRKHHIKCVKGRDIMNHSNKLYCDIIFAEAVRMDASAVFGTRTVSFILVKM